MRRHCAYTQPCLFWSGSTEPASFPLFRCHLPIFFFLLSPLMHAQKARHGREHWLELSRKGEAWEQPQWNMRPSVWGGGGKKKTKHGGMKVSVRIKASSGMTLSVRNKVTLGLVTDHCGHYTERNNLSYTFSDSPSKTMQQSSLWMEDTALMDQWSDLWAEVNGDRIKTDERTSFNRQYILPNSVCAIHPTPRKYRRPPPTPPTKS